MCGHGIGDGGLPKRSNSSYVVHVRTQIVARQQIDVPDGPLASGWAQGGSHPDPRLWAEGRCHSAQVVLSPGSGWVSRWWVVG